MQETGGVRLSGGPVLDGEHSMLESDVSSIIDISDHIVASDTDESGDERFLDHDTQKYRMPDVGKTRLHLLTKEPLSPTPRQPRSPRSPGHRSSQAPGTPRSRRSMVKTGSPRANGSGDYISDSEFISSGISRAGSIYSLSRVSFTSQLSQLTNIKLPDASSLSKKISSIPTSTAAARTLSDAADQIQIWIKKAGEVLNGLNAEDDVEWAAAGGRDGLGEVDLAINKFESLVNVYVIAIEHLQMRKDISELSHSELNGTVKQMETILQSWQKIKNTLKGVKEQVEIALEYEELWNHVLGEIGKELKDLENVIFEMEERRHQGVIAESLVEGNSFDIGELETIVEETPGRALKTPGSNRYSLLPPFSPTSPIQKSAATEETQDSNLLALFARMQPMRASLDFLPMRLSVFHCRGNPVFPTACLELERRRDDLEKQWKKLEADAESLRRELGEDRWVLVFRNAGRQALKMCESVRRSEIKLREALDNAEPTPSTSKKIESYEAKKMHYGPAIERVLAIIDRGVLDRLTVNGEILRLQSDMRRRWSTLQADLRDMDIVLEDMHVSSRNQQLRDSISTILSSERSISSSRIETPGSSPASSVVAMSRKSSFQESKTPTPLVNTKLRQSSATISAKPSPTASRLPSSSSIPRRTPLTRSSVSRQDIRSSPSPSPSLPKSSPLPEPPEDNRPKWKTTGRGSALGRDFPPLSAFEPSPYAKTLPQPKLRTPSSAGSSHLPMKSPLGRNTSSPMPTWSRSPLQSQRKTSLPLSSQAGVSAGSPLAAKAASAAMGRSSPSPYVSPYSQAVISANRRRSSLAPPEPADENDADTDSPSSTRRPPTALASGRRNSMLPQAARSRSRLGDVTGDKPRWKG